MERGGAVVGGLYAVDGGVGLRLDVEFGAGGEIDVLAMDERACDNAERPEDGDACERGTRSHGEVLHLLLRLFADEGGHIRAVECLRVLEVDLNLRVASEIFRLLYLCDGALTARALCKDEDITDKDIVRNLILDRIADLEVLCVDGGHESDLNERVRGDRDGGDGDLLPAEGCH